MIVNPDRNYDRDANENNINYNAGKPSQENYEKQKLAAAFQILYRGAPMIYYGDEVGMWGADDPHCRKPMVWDDLKYDDEVINEHSGFKTGFGSFTVEQNKDLLKYYKMIIEIRNCREELNRGIIKFIYSNNEKSGFAFESVLGDKKTICIFNLGSDILSTSFDFELIEVYPNEPKNKNKFSINRFNKNEPILISPNSFGIYSAK